MADVNKTVDIAVRADMKQLLNEFKKMPGMTAKEAKKMVSMLEREFKQAEKAAKKAADANARAMKRMGDSAKQSAKEVRQLKRSSQEMGSALQATGDIVGELDPALGGLVATLSIAGTAIRDLGKALLTGNPYILGAVAAAGAAAAAYTLFTAESRKAEEQQKLVAEAVSNLNEKLNTQKNIANELVTANRNASTQLKLFTGQMTQLEANLAQLRGQAADQLASQFEKQDEIIKKQKDQISLVQKAKDNYKSLTEEEQKQLNLIAASSQKAFIREGIASNVTKRMGQINRLQEELNGRLNKEISFKDKIKKTSDDTLAQQEDLAKLQAEYQQEVKEEEARQKRLAEAASARAKKEAELAKADLENKRNAAKEEQRLKSITDKISQSSNAAQQQADSINLANQRIKISMMDTELERISEQANLEQSLIEAKIQAAEKEKEQNITLAETEEQILLAKLANQELDKQIEAFKEESFLKEMQFSNERMKALEKEKKKRQELVEAIFNQSVEATEAVSQIIKNVSGENKEAAMIAFRINQAAALANIAMTTAQKIMEVAPNPFAIAGVSALGALQAGVVATQPAPEFHMGGVIDKGEDTRNITVLTGEAVLDRRTVENLGGDAGINRLQRGKALMQPEIIVTNPYKHFDRYAMASSKRGGVMKRFSNNKASGAY